MLIINLALVLQLIVADVLDYYLARIVALKLTGLLVMHLEKHLG